MSTDTHKDISAQFQAAVVALESDAKKVGLTITSICRETGVSRATPDRWKREAPTTVQLLAKMQALVERKKRERGIK